MPGSALHCRLLPLVLTTLLAACDKQVPPVAPVSGIQPATTAQQDHFYYHLGEPVPLVVDAGRIIVSTSASDAIATTRNALAGIQAEISAGRRVGQRLALPHTLLRLRSGDAESIVARLRSDARFAFASLTYVSADPS